MCYVKDKKEYIFKYNYFYILSKEKLKEYLNNSQMSSPPRAQELPRKRRSSTEANEDLPSKQPLLSPPSCSQPVPTPSRQIETVESNFYLSKSRVNYIDFIWKFDVPKKFSNINHFEIVDKTARDNQKFSVALMYVHYPKSVCGRILCAFNYNKDVSEEKFKKIMQNAFTDIKNDDNEESNAANEENNNEMEKDENNNEMEKDENNDENMNNSSDNESMSKTISSNLSNESLSSNKMQNDDISSIPSVIAKIISDQSSFHIMNENNENSNSPSDAQTYDATLSMFIPSSKYSSSRYKSISLNKILISYLDIPTFALMSSSLTVVIEGKISKNYNISEEHVGIINEGMTCYMNAMIQSLNVLGYLKRGIFAMPYDNDESSLSYSLQRLFYDLDFEHEPASTNRLIHSFGWSRDDIFIQHDVQEFTMMLSDLMEKKMKGSKSDEVFKFLFEGKLANEIKCVDYAYTSRKEEKFNDIQLNVRGCKNIYDSFNKFTEEETLDGDDKYLVEGHGKEKAIKRMKFLSLPPVLMLQLKRFEYNPKKDQMDKINDYYEFYPHIDMKPYIDDNTDTDTQYDLVSVVVHKGNVYGGHYFAFIRNDINDSKWFCFNDECVREADEFEVFDINFGGAMSLFKYKESTNSVIENTSKSDLSAYVLIYVKRNKADMVLKPIKIEEIPSEIVKEIVRDKKKEKKCELMKERKMKNIDVYFLSYKMLSLYKGIGLSRGIVEIYDDSIQTMYDDEIYNNYINLPKDFVVNDLYQFMVKLMNIQIMHFGLYLLCLQGPGRVSSRFEFKMHFIDYSKHGKVEIWKLFEEFDESYKASKRMFIYIDTAMTPLEPLIENENCIEVDSEDEDDEISLKYEGKEIYIPKNNRYKFNKMFPKCINQNGMMKKLLIMKIINPIKKEIYIEKVFCVHINNNGEFIDLKEIDEILKFIKNDVEPYYKNIFIINNINTDIVFFIENSCYDKEETEKIEEQNNSQYKCPLISYTNETIQINFPISASISPLYSFKKLFLSNATNDAFIIYPLLNHSPSLTAIQSILTSITTSVFVPCAFINEALPKKEFSLLDKENEIKEKILRYYDKKEFLKLLKEERDSDNCFIYFIGEEKLISYEEFVDNNMNASNIILIPKIQSKKKEEVLNYPLLRYIGNMKKEYVIDFKISTNTKRNENFSLIIVSLRDRDNNIIADFDIYIPEDEVDNFNLSDLLSTLQDKILHKFYKNETSFTFMAEHNTAGYNFDHLNMKMTIRENMSTQVNDVYWKNVIIPTEQNKENSFGFIVAFQFEDQALCPPIILNVDKESKVIDIKNILIKKMNRMTKLKENENIDINDWKNMKMYTYSTTVYDGVLKEMLILDTKNEEKIIELLNKGGKMHSLLVEFKALKKEENSHK